MGEPVGLEVEKDGDVGDISGGKLEHAMEQEGADDIRSHDSSRDRGDHRHRKKKRHRHRSRGSVESGQAAGIGHDGDKETGGESSGENDNIVVESSTRKRRSKSSSRHHKHSSHGVVSGEDSGLSLGNSLNDSTPLDPPSRLAPENDDQASTDGHNADSEQSRPHPSDTADSGHVEHEDSVHEGREDVGKQTTPPSSQNTDHTKTDIRPVKELPDTQPPMSTEIKPDDVDDNKKTGRTHRRLERQKTQYRLEKEALKQRLDDTKAKFEAEISKYEEDLTEQRQQYLEHLSSLRLQEQYESLRGRFSDLTGLEEELDKRLKDCLEQQKDVEEMERFLNTREELCRSKERDIIKLDDELDAWRGELDIKKRQLGSEDASRRMQSTMSTSFSKPTTDEEDYILKKNLQKCQADLARSEAQNTSLHKEMDAIKKQLVSSQLQTKTQEQKIKQLESQLVLSLSQLGNPKSSLPPINGHRPSNASSSVEEIRRLEMERRREVSLQRLQGGKDQLSLNQEAALRRKLAGKDGGTASTSRHSTTASSRLDVRGAGKRKFSGSAGSSCSGEGGGTPGVSDQKSPDPSDAGMSSVKSTDSQKSEKSSVCTIM